MGLAASQAKLLSLTCRISDNELRAQSLTAAKMALANQTSEASREYLKALNTNEFVYRTYDDSGEKVYTKLTGAQLSTYAPLKNQYALINPQGQVLVSELDAANYEDSANINEFLEKYGVDQIETGETRTVRNPEYDVDYERWKKEYDEWMKRKPDPNDEKYWVLKENPNKNTELYDQFISAVTQCGCWWGEPHVAVFYHIEHILAKMLDYDSDFVAYPGTSKEVKYHKLGKDERGEGGSITQGNPWSDASEAIMVEVRDKIKNNEKDPELWQDIVNMYYETVKTYGYTYNYDCLSIIKSVDNGEPAMSQHDIELAVYDADESDGWDSLIERLKYAFVEEVKVFLQEDYDGDIDKWKKEEPDPVTVSATNEEKIYEYSDKDKAQWYVNLWHRMNGASDDKDGTETTTKTTSSTEVYSYGVKTTKTTDTATRNRWDILEDGLMNSQDWLKYALESGAVTLERVNFADPTEEGTGIRKAQWTSIIYSNALDISEQTDEAAIARAEAKYQQKTREIENKDKQYDSMLKLLDTEHNALQQEYETTKTVISKNTERTIKIYQA